MNPVEYLQLFSNSGKTRIKVKFKDLDDTVATQIMEPAEITRLVSPESGEFIKSMNFDDWPFEIYKYEIDPIKSTLTIYARKPQNQTTQTYPCQKY